MYDASRRRSVLTRLASAALLTCLAVAGESAVSAAERNPPGDIPDNQVFVTYTSPAGFSLDVPEGWARTERSDGVRFTDKYNIIDVAVTAAAATPTVASASTHEGADLAKTGRAVKIDAVRNARLASGAAILIAYSSNSHPNAVTGKSLRQEHHRYLIYRNGKLATIDLAAPLGADNADQWKHIANSFRWR